MRVLLASVAFALVGASASGPLGCVYSDSGITLSPDMTRLIKKVNTFLRSFSIVLKLFCTENTQHAPPDLKDLVFSTSSVSLPYVDAFLLDVEDDALKNAVRNIIGPTIAWKTQLMGSLHSESAVGVLERVNKIIANLESKPYPVVPDFLTVLQTQAAAAQAAAAQAAAAEVGAISQHVSHAPWA